MTTAISEVHAPADLRRFIRFPMDLYRRERAYVPPLMWDEKSLLQAGSPAHDECDYRLFLARRDGKVVGRLAAIVNHVANRHLGTRNVRFGWFDSIEDQAVAAALFDAAEDWGRRMGMETMSGPLGFTGFDKAGMLIDGFQHLPTIATSYNFPYYSALVEKHGFEKEIDTVEYLIRDIREMPARLIELAARIRRKSPCRLVEIPSRAYMLSRKEEVLDLMEGVFADLWDAFPTTSKQRAFYADKFFPYLHKDLVKIAANEKDELVGFIIAMPSLSEAFRKAGGRLFPCGAWHLWRAMHGGTKLLDFCVGGVKKGYRRMGLDLMMGVDLCASAIKLGFVSAESNPELETNHAVQSEWKHLDHVLTKRRRIYAKHI